STVDYRRYSTINSDDTVDTALCVQTIVLLPTGGTDDAALFSDRRYRRDITQPTVNADDTALPTVNADDTALPTDRRYKRYSNTDRREETIHNCVPTVDNRRYSTTDHVYTDDTALPTIYSDDTAL
ncbi:unnamed protein product, partial [Laminaria digitata]